MDAAEHQAKVIEVLDVEPFLPPAVVDLAMWVAEYYACGPGDALAAAMPPAKAHKTVRTVTPRRAQGHEPESALAKSGRRRRSICCAAAPDGLASAALNERGISTDVLRRLAVKGLVDFQPRAHRA